MLAICYYSNELDIYLRCILPIIEYQTHMNRKLSMGLICDYGQYRNRNKFLEYSCCTFDGLFVLNVLKLSKEINTYFNFLLHKKKEILR